MKMKKIIMTLALAGYALAGFSAYRTIGTGTEPNEWTSNYDGVLAAAKQTGSPIVLVVVDSVTCGHCHTLNALTLSSGEFKALENDLVFYRVMIDRALVSESLYNYVLRIYSRYFNDGMFPLIAVLRQDGSVYGSYGNRNTDVRNVSSDIRSWVETLSAEQTGGVVANESETQKPTETATTASSWAAILKAKSSGVAFDASEQPVASVALKIAKNGKATVKLTTMSSIVTVKGVMTLGEDGVPQVVAGDLAIEYDPTTGVWRGFFGDLLVLVAQGKASSSGYDGLYTFSAAGADGVENGYATVTVRNGKGKFKGQVNGSAKINANCPVAAIQSEMIATNLPTWEATDSLFVPGVKRGKSSGGVAIAKDGAAYGEVSIGNSDWMLEGAKWDTATSLGALDGLKLVLVTGEKPEIPLSMTPNGRKIATASNAYSAKISVQPRKGTFKGSVKLNGARSKFVGALIKRGDAVRGFGTSYGAAGSFPVWIE